MLLALASIVLFIVAALAAFGAISANAVGFLCIGLALLAAHHITEVHLPRL